MTHFTDCIKKDKPEVPYWFIFDVWAYDIDTFEKCHERGAFAATSYLEAMRKLTRWYGDSMCDVRLYDVNIDTDDLLFERNFPGLIEMLEDPKEC